MKSNIGLMFGISVFSVLMGHTASLRAMEEQKEDLKSFLPINLSVPSFHLSLKKLRKFLSEEGIERRWNELTPLYTPKDISTEEISSNELSHSSHLLSVLPDDTKKLLSQLKKVNDLSTFQMRYYLSHEYFFIKPFRAQNKNDEVVPQPSAPLPSSFIPLYHVQTLQNGEFYLLGTTHNKSGTSIPEYIWKIINEKCSYGIQESFTGKEPYYKENGKLLENEIDNYLKTNPCFFLNPETYEFYQSIHQKFQNEGYYNNKFLKLTFNKSHNKLPQEVYQQLIKTGIYNPDLINQIFNDPLGFELALKLIANPKNWSKEVFGYDLRYGEQELNPLIFTSRRFLHKLEKNPYIKSLFTKNYEGGMDETLDKHFTDKGQPLYGFEGYKDDFLSTNYLKPLQKLATFISSPLCLPMINKEGKPDTILELDLHDTILIKLSRLMNNKNFIKKEFETSDSIQVIEGKAGHYLYEDPDLHHRNQIWANRTPELLKMHPNEPPFIFVGASHTIDYLKKLKDLLGDLEIKHYHEGSWQPFSWDNIRRVSRTKDSEGD